jgi:predicted dehydrogenase
LAVPIKGDFEEGFQVYGENGSAAGKIFLPWFHKTSVVECFSARDGQFHRPLGEDAYTYKTQIEGFADGILHGLPMTGANIDDGVAAMRAMVSIARSVESGEKVILANASGAV